MRMTWEDMFLRAKEYYEQNGHLRISQSYVCEDGVNLGKWLHTQRAVANGLRNGIMDKMRREKLDSIGMDWHPNETAWNKGFEELKAYHSIHGNCDVPLRYQSNSGFKLGLWLQNQRRSYLKKGRGAINQEQIDSLNSLGIVWDPYQEQWQKQYELVKEYYETHGHIDIPTEYTIDGYNIGRWLQTQRDIYKETQNDSLTAEQQHRLDALSALNISYENKLELHWEKMYQLAKQYFECYGHLSILSSYTLPDGTKLGNWVFTQRNNWRTQNLSQKRIDLLNEIGMVWDYSQAKQTSFYEQAIAFYVSTIFEDTTSRDKSNGIEIDVYIPSLQIGIEYDGQLYHTIDNLERDEQKNEALDILGISLFRIREAECPHMKDDSNNIYLEENTIPAFEIALQTLFSKLGIEEGIDIDVNRDSGLIYRQYLMIGPPISSDDVGNYILTTEWMEYYECAKRYYQEHGHLLIIKAESYEDKDLGKWVNNQRHYYNSKQRTLATQKVELLNAIGMVWNKNDASWELGFSHALKYYQEHGNLDVESNYIIDGYDLGHWIRNQRTKYTERYSSSGKLSKSQIDRLNSIGMIWDALDHRWKFMFELAKDYYNSTGSLLVPCSYCVDGHKLGQWILTQRENYKSRTNPNFTDEKIKQLESIGMVWEIGKGKVRPKQLDQNWIEMFNILEKELNITPANKITKRYTTADGVKIGSWLNRQRRVYKGNERGVLLDWQIEMLKSLEVL